MKPHLPLTLLSALMAAFSASAVPTSFMADGVDPDNLAQSERFYDVGKGYYWSYATDQPYNGAMELYNANHNFSFLGDLAPYVSSPFFSKDAFTPLRQDGQTCGYQVPANMIQYWLSYYGPFYTGSEPLAYGYTYSRDYLEKLGGTQSLAVGMLFYDSWEDVGNNTAFCGKWYFCGTPNDRLKPGASAGGFFADYFDEKDIVYLLFDPNDTQYSNYRALGVKSFTHELVKGFGMEEAADGSYSVIRPGQIVYLSLEADDKEGGHAITCYGFEADADGMVTALKVVNSDDRKYSLFTLYVKENKQGYMSLYTDEACTQLWRYSETTWRINGMEYIHTPDRLVELYHLYAAPDTKLVWTGVTNIWSADYMPATTDALPGKETGWAVEFAGLSFNSYYSEEHPITFDDSALSGEIHLTSPATRSSLVPREMHLHNAALDYVFIGESGDRLMPEQLVIDGTGTASFRNLLLSTGSVFYETYTLRMEDGARLSADDISVSRHGVLELAGGAVTARNSLTFGSAATLRVSEISALSGAVTLQAGSVFDCVLSAENTTTALLSVTGSLTLGGTVKLEIEGSGLTAGTRYRVCTVSSGTLSTSNFFTEHGSLSFSDNTLWLTYREVPSYVWSGGSGQWSATKFGNTARNTVHADITFNGGSGTITLSGQVTPHHLSLHGGTYTFTGTNASIDCEGYVNLDNKANLTLNVPVSAQGILLEEGSTLTMNLGKNSTLSYISAEKNTHLNFRGAVTYDVEDSGVLGCAISVGSGTSLDIHLTHDEYLEGLVTAASTSSVIRFENDAVSRDIVIYETDGNMEHFQGSVYVGREGAARRTTLSLDAAPGVGTYTVATGSTLLINGGSTFDCDVRGTGTLSFGPGTEVAVKVENGRTTFADTLTLEVQGGTVIGTLGDRLSTQLARNLSVSGLLTVHVAGGTTLEYDRVTMDDGAYAFLTTVETGDVTNNIKELHIGKGDGAFIRLMEANTAYTGYAGKVCIDRLTGTGKLNFSGSHFVQMSYNVINGVGAEGFTGDIHVENTGTFTDEYYHLTALELGSGEYGGGVLLINAKDNQFSRTSLGISGDVTLHGLEAEDWGKSYLYSGFLKTTKLDTKNQSPESMLTLQEHTLTLDTATDFHFAGDVLGPLNLVKKGNGRQSFLGDMSAFCGSATVSVGTLLFAHDVSLASATVENKGCLTGEAALGVTGALSMTGGTLSAKALTTTTASFAGQASILADSISSKEAWTVNVGTANLNAAALELRSLSGAESLTLGGGLNICYNPSAVSIASYKVLTLSSDYKDLLSGLTIRRNGAIVSLGAAGSSPLYLQQTASGAYDLILEITDGLVTMPREEKTVLNWQTSTGTWSVGSGEPSGDWKGADGSANFHNGDDVVFGSAATVSLSGAVSPSSVTVSNTSGTVAIKAGNTQATISGRTSLVKSGAGTLSIATANTYTGGTFVKGGTLTVGNASALGTGAVSLSGGTLNTGSYAVKNAVTATGGTFTGKSYAGTLTIAGNVKLGTTPAAATLNLNSGTLTGNVSSSKVRTINANGGKLSGSLTLDGGTLNLGKQPLVVSGALTLSAVTRLGLSSYTAPGSYTLISAGSIVGSTDILSYAEVSNHRGYDISIRDNALMLTITQLANSLTWTSATGTWAVGTSIGGTAYANGDSVTFANTAAANVTIAGTVSPGGITVQGGKDVIFNSDLKKPGVIAGSGDIVKNGNASLTMNNGNTYTGDTVLNSGTLKAAGVTSFGNSSVIVNGGTLDMGFNAVANPVTVNGAAVVKGSKYMGKLTIDGDLLKTSAVTLSQNATLLSGTVSGVLSGTAGVTVKGNVTYDAKQTYKGMTTLESGSLTLTSAAGIAGSITVKNGVLTLPSGGTGFYAVNGLSLAKDQVLDIQGGTVKGDVTAAAGATIRLHGGTLNGTPTLTGGTLDLGSSSMVELNSLLGGNVRFGTQDVALKGKGIIYSGDALTVSSGSVTFNASAGYTADIYLTGGTLTAGMTASDVFGRGTIHVSGGTLDFGFFKDQNATVELTGSGIIKGSKYTGKLTLNGNLLKTSAVTLSQNATLLSGTVSGVLSGTAGVTVKGNVTYDAKQTYKGMTTLESGSLTLTSAAGIAGSITVKNGVLTLPSGGTGFYAVNGLSLAKDQVLDIRGGTVKGDVTAAAGATIRLNGGTLNGTPTLAGGTLDLGSSSMVELNSLLGGNVSFGSQNVALKGKGIIYSGDALTVSSGSVTFNASAGYTSDIYLTGGTLTAGMTASDVFGRGTIHVSGGTLDFGFFKDQNATVELTGSGIIKGSKYTGKLTLNGNLLKTSAVTLSQNATLLSGTVSGVLSGTAGVTVKGNVTYDAKQTYKGMTTLESGSLTLTSAAGIAGSITVKNGVLTLPSGGTGFYAVNGLSLAKDQVLDIRGGTVKGDVTAAAGATIRLNGGTLQGTPTLTGGTLDLGSTSMVELNSLLGGNVRFGTQDVALKGKGIIYSGDALTVSSGSVTFNASAGYTSDIYLTGGTLTAGMSAANVFGRGTIHVSGGTLDFGMFKDQNATVELTGSGIIKGSKYTGKLTLNGNLLKTSAVTLSQNATLLSGTVSGVLSGTAGVTVKGNVTYDAKQTYKGMTTLESGSLKLTSAAGIAGSITVKNGVLTLPSGGTGFYAVNGLSLAKDQVLDIQGGTVKGDVTAAAGATIRLNGGTLQGTPTLTGGTLDLGSSSMVELNSLLGGNVSFGSQNVALKGKGIIYSGDALTVSSGSVTFNASAGYTADIYLTGGTLTAGMTASDVFGRGTIHVSGGTLDFGMFKDQNATVELTGSGIIKGSKYTGKLTIDGDLLKTSAVTLSQNATLLSGTVSGVMSGTAGVTVKGNVTYDAKQTYKGMTTLESGSLTLTSAAGIAGSITVKNGVLTLPSGGTGFYAVNGLSLAKDQVLDIRGGTVKGDVTAAAGATIRLNGGTLNGTPTLAGGTLDLGGTASVEVSCLLNGGVASGAQAVALKGKGTILSDARLSVTEGNVTINALRNYTDVLEVQGGTLTLGRDTVTNDILVTGTGAVNNGLAHRGNITVNGSLDKGTTIKLLSATQHVDLNAAGPVQGTISGTGTVNVNARVDASNATLSASTIRINSGSVLTNTKGIMLALNQQYALNGGTVSLSGKALTTMPNSTLSVLRNSSVSGNLTLGGGMLVMASGSKLNVSGLLTLSSATQLTLSGSWGAGNYTLISFGSVKMPLRGSLDEFFKVGSGMHLTSTNNSIVLTLSGARTSAVNSTVELPAEETERVTLAEAAPCMAVADALPCAAADAPETEVLSMNTTVELPAEETERVTLAEAAPCMAVADALPCAAAEAPETVADDAAETVAEAHDILPENEIVEVLEAETAPALLAAVPAPAALATPVADALVQADYGIVEATRAFTDSLSGHRTGSVLVDKGAGSVWVAALGHISRYGSQGAHNGADHNISGAAFGVEHRIGETGAAGLAVGRTQNRIGTTGLSHLRQETAHVALYGQKTLRHGFTADVTAAWGDTDTRADFGGERLTFSQHSAELAARLTHSRALSDDTVLRSFGALSYDATDCGSSADVRTGSVQNLRAEAGLGFSTALSSSFSLFGEAALVADVMRHNPTADVVGYREHGSNPGRLGARATVGAAWQFNDSWSAHATYSFETEARNTSHNVNIGASKSF